ILGCLTTIGAFTGLLFIDSELLNDFGMFATFSLIGSTVFGLVFLPHFMKKEGNRRSDRAFRLLDKINTYPIDRKPVFVATIALICVVCIAFSWKVEFDPDLKNIGYYNPKVVKSGKLLAEKTSNGMDAVYFASAGNTLDEALTNNRAFAATLDSACRAGLIHQYAHTSDILLPNAIQQQRIDRWHKFWTPERKAAVKKSICTYGQRYGFTEEVFEPFFELIDNDFAPDNMIESGVIPEALMSNWIEKAKDRYMVFTQVQMPYGTRDQVCDRILTKGGHSMVIDPFYYTQDMAKVLIDDFNIVLLISSVFVFIVLLLSFRNLLLSLIAFLPMGLSWYIVQGVMVFLGLKFNLINIIISAFIFGVGVDYSIFIMDGLLAESRKKDRLLIQHKAAILLSAIVLIISVSSLIFATHPSLKSTGITTLIGMTATIIIAYTFEPFLFHHLTKYPFFQRIINKHNNTFKPEA
ncbi:MAG: MMPL family transporter, partial [Paludibacteraceae bacterium]|nr:MMPL family transporter [Paludibacteraceae bacterium]